MIYLIITIVSIIWLCAILAYPEYENKLSIRFAGYVLIPAIGAIAGFFALLIHVKAIF